MQELSLRSCKVGLVICYLCLGQFKMAEISLSQLSMARVGPLPCSASSNTICMDGLK